MKYIITSMIAVLLTISQTSAGILEYNMWQKVKTNASKEESVDAIKTIQVTPPRTQDRYNYTPKYEFGEYYRYYKEQNTSLYRHPAVTRAGKKYTKYYSDVLENLEKDARNIHRELEYVEDRIYDLTNELKYDYDYRSYKRERLEEERKYMKQRKKDLEKLKKDVDKEISEVKKNKRYYKKYDRYDYRYYHGYSYPSYKYWNYYDDYHYYYYRSNFVNPDLKDVKEGRIYIR